ncbi:MAG: TonB family protein [Acidobacteriota bacterium]|nr:TonB family protein [Acidobacteriota bacterium]
MNSHQRFADYILFERIASTSFGDCFRAGFPVGRVVDHHVLLQIFNGASLDSDQFWQLVADRRSLLESLHDPYLGECLAFDCIGDTPFAVYSFAPSASLRPLFSAVREKEIPVPVDQALLVVDRAALGLTGAHRIQHRGRPVLHGFLVPDLIRLSGEGAVRVLGIEAAPGLRSQLAAHPACAGYLAPEVRAGEPPSACDDVFSLGSILFQLLSGTPIPTKIPTSMPDILESATLAATDELLPSALRALLAASLAPRDKRIHDVISWQQELGAIILDGGHTPTTFNLSLLMHTVFGQELAEEQASMDRELALRLPPSSPTRVETVVTPTPETRPTSATPYEETLTEKALPNGGFRHSFTGGFLVSFLAAAILFSLYFLFRAPLDATAEASLPTSRPIATSATHTSNPGEFDDSRQVGDDATQTAVEPEDALSATAEVTGPRAAPRPSESREVDSAARQTEEVEAGLRAQYEQRVAELERQLAQAREPAIPDRTSDARIPAEAGSASAVADSAAPTVSAERGPDRAAVQPNRQRPEPVRDESAATSTPTSQQPAAPPVAESASAPASTSPDLTQQASSTDENSSQIVFVPPRLESSPRPTFPSAARRMRKTARVQVRVRVDATGRVQETELPGAPAGFGFDRAATAAARRSRWTPATRDGEPVESWALLTIEFQL